MEQFHNDVLDIVRKTRDISLPGFGSAAITHDKGEFHTDVVTEADQKIETVLKTELAKTDPSAVFVGEEFGGDRNAEKYWISDPIDGTGLYVRGIPYCTTMLALVAHDQVQFGVIYDFVNDVMYYAVRGHGAFADGVPLNVSDRSTQNDRVYVTHEIKGKNPHNEKVRSVLNEKCGFLQYLCAGYEYVLVASGKIEGRICSDPFGYDYDYAPGCLLVEEAGGIVTTLDGQPYRPSVRPHIAANPMLHKELTEGPDALFPVNQ